MALRPSSVCGVILVTDDVERLAAFYRDVLGLPLEREEHSGLPVHYGVDVGTTHLGIHPPASFGRVEARAGGTVVALQVDDLDACLAGLAANGIEPAIAKHDEGFGPVAAVEDPDGNLIELVELSYDFEEERA
ncbi:MAG TPA: VOC family protein [Allosphingosinicella sp.]|nr:VOC family protein [Allosphingosinicella sp.]